ncbi:MAG: ribonuclease R [Desulfuromonadales bacterium C00003096]|nr:MAG: ribonuclease R [Desulfuromonadales bacterium C00003096]
MSLSPDELLAHLKKHPGRSLSVREILAAFPLPRHERQAARLLIENMADDGLLQRVKGNRYRLVRNAVLLQGKVTVHRAGYGFVVLDDKGKEDVFVPARHLGAVMDGDRVAVRIVRSERYGRPGRSEGRIVQVLERARQELLGRYELHHRQAFVVPVDPRLPQPIQLTTPSSVPVNPGQIVVLRIDSYPTANRPPFGTILRVLGDADDPAVEIAATAYKYGLPADFEPEVLAAASALPTVVSPEDLQGREDLRELPLVTIDGETAMDFDDAVAVRREEQGRIRLWVAIADVGYYVAPGSPIDQQALERSTSVYFPGHCIPMLPESLSNEICSLKPQQDRLAMVAELLFDAQGQRLESRFYSAVIRSQARLTYSQVRDMIEPGAALENAEQGELLGQLQVMEELAQRLTTMRRQRGSLDFDLPEAEVVLGLRGRPEDIVRAERNMAHRIIEEFMLAANEAVATFLHERQAPLLFRIHEEPELEKLQAFQEFVAYLNYGLVIDGQGDTAHQLQALLAKVAGRPEERMINQVLLRSMKQARYDAKNVGHFGLAAELYCHFTSPIRRYPDLVVHRILREVLTDEKKSHQRASWWQRQLPAIAEQCSVNERRAMEAERDVIDLKKCQFMADRVGEEFQGIVSGVQPFGFFVELQQIFVEGLVPVASLEDDYYEYEEHLHRLLGQRRRKIYQIGMEVSVRLRHVDLDRRQIDFEPVQNS